MSQEMSPEPDELTEKASEGLGATEKVEMSEAEIERSTLAAIACEDLVRTIEILGERGLSAEETIEMLKPFMPLEN